MRSYAIFGGCLESALEFPSLRPEPSAAVTWRLHVRSPAALPSDAIALGADDVDKTSKVRLHRSSLGWHLSYDDTGRFDIDASGQEIEWRGSTGASLEDVRLDVMGRVLPTALHAAGALCLHASAVAVGDGIVAFVGAKGHGKSTLAWALTRAGTRLVTDDTLRVEGGEAPIAYPGVHELRLRADAAHQLVSFAIPRRAADDRFIVQPISDAEVQATPAPLAAIYLLTPVRQLSTGEAFRSFSLPPVPSALSLVRHAKIAPLLTGHHASELLDRVIQLTRVVPVRVLQYVHDFDVLDEVCRHVLERHSPMVGGVVG